MPDPGLRPGQGAATSIMANHLEYGAPQNSGLGAPQTPGWKNQTFGALQTP